MKRSVTETVLGAVVLLVAALFLSYSYKLANVNTEETYPIIAEFSSVGGLKSGDSVQISGVKVGSVDFIELAQDSFLARVHVNIGKKYKLPTDTSASISSESLMGGLYMSLQPGSEEEMLEPSGKIQFTQAPQNLEQLLGQFIFSLQDEKSEEKTANN